MFANQIDEKFWLDPPWLRYPQKYNLGLRPIKLKDWLASNPSDEILNHKKKLLSTNYERVVSTVNHPDNPEFILSKHFQTNSIYPDLIANISLEVEDDLCIIESQGDQKLLAACVCSPSYWKLSDKIGKPLLSIHKPVKTLNSKIGNSINKFISQSPLLKPFVRENWFVHEDTDRFHDHSERLKGNDPSNWFIRTERESICKFSEKFSLFSINVRFQKLSYILEFDEAKTSLFESLQNFDDDESSYFGGRLKINLLLDYLK